MLHGFCYVVVLKLLPFEVLLWISIRRIQVLMLLWRASGIGKGGSPLFAGFLLYCYILGSKVSL